MDFSLIGNFLLALLVSAGLGIDNGLVIDFSIRGLGLKERSHMWWRSVALIAMAVMRIGFLFAIGHMAWLNLPQPNEWWLPNTWFSNHPEELQYFHLLLFVGGLVVICMAFWEYYKKWREELKGEHDAHAVTSKPNASRVLMVATYIVVTGALFSIDSVFTLLSLLDVETQFGTMVVVVLLAAVIMVFGMIPLGKLVHRSLHIGVQMLTVLVVIGAKLLVDGTGGHFSNGLLTFIIMMILLNDVGQAALEKADELGNLRASKRRAAKS